MTRPADRDNDCGLYQVRPAARDDAATIWRFVEASEQLDRNSYYCYVVLTELFPATCLIAQDHAARSVGFVTAVPTPERPGELFVWQLYVDLAERGRGVGMMLLRAAVQAAGVTVVRATVVPRSQAALSTFTALARHMGAPLTVVPYLSSADFPPEAGAHQGEDMITIG